MRIRTGSDCNPVGLIQYPEQCLKPPSISLIHKNLMNTKHPEDTIMWHHLARGSTCNGNSQARQNYHHSCIHMYRKQPVSSEMTTMITYIRPLIRNFDTIHKMCLLPMVQIPWFFSFFLMYASRHLFSFGTIFALPLGLKALVISKPLKFPV